MYEKNILNTFSKQWNILKAKHHRQVIFFSYKRNQLDPTSNIFMVRQINSPHCKHEFIMNVFTVAMFYCTCITKKMNVVTITLEW